MAPAKKVASKKAPQVGKTKTFINKIAPVSIKDAFRRSVKLFFFVVIPLIPYNAITEADASVLHSAVGAGVCAVFAYLANVVLNWASSWDAKEA